MRHCSFEQLILIISFYLRRLNQIEKKIIVGGENLLEKAEEQERLLQESAAELDERRRREDELRKALEAREAERIDIEEKYSSLQVLSSSIEML